MRKAVCLILALLVVALLAIAGCGGSSSFGDSGPITLNPPSGSALPGGQVQFTLNQTELVDWTAPDGGSVTDGLFTAPNVTGTYRVVATSVLNPLNSATATVTVADVQVSVTPSMLVVPEGGVATNAFTALVQGNPNNAVTWSVEPSGAGSIGAGTADGSGNPRATFTAGTTPGVFTVRATSQADPTVSGVAQVTVLGSNSLGLSPSSVTLGTTTHNSVVLNAVLTDASGQVDTTTGLTWDVPLNPVGGILTGSDSRQLTFTVPTDFVGIATCQVRVRSTTGLAAMATIQVISN